MSAPLGAFVPKPAQTGEKFQANAALGRPLIVQVVGVDGARQVSGQNGQGTQVKKAVTVHVWDLIGGPIAQDATTGQIMMGPQNTVYCNVMWMAAAVADQLGEFNGAPPMPIKLLKQKNKGNEYSHIAPVPLEGPELQQVQAFFAQDPTRIDREAAAKAQAAAAQSAAPAYQQTGFTPMQVQPSTPQPGEPAQQQMPAPAAAQFQAPSEQPGAIANIPAQVAQQYSPVDQAAQQLTPGAMVNAGQMTPAQAVQAYQTQQPNPVQQAFQQHQAQVNGGQYPQQGQPSAPVQGGMSDWDGSQTMHPAVGQQFQQPAQSQVPAGGQAFQQMPAPAGVQVPQAAPAQQVNGGEYPQQGQPQFQQPPAAAPGQPGYVQNSDVANILNGLAAGQPQQ